MFKPVSKLQSQNAFTNKISKIIVFDPTVAHKMFSAAQKCFFSLVGLIALIELRFALPVVMVDLSYNYDEKTPTFSAHVPFESRNRRSVHYNNVTFQTAELYSSEHAGTHMDAPYHFNKLKQTMEEVPLELFEGPGVIIDIREKVANNSDAQVEMEDIEKWEKINGPIQKGSIVFMNSGWQQYAYNQTVFAGISDPNEPLPLHFPGFHIDACRFLILSRGIRTMGSDTLSFDYGQTRDFPCHQLLASVSGVGLENIANLDKVPAKGSFIKAYPMKIKGGSAAPTRVIASIAQPNAVTSQ